MNGFVALQLSDDFSESRGRDHILQIQPYPQMSTRLPDYSEFFTGRHCDCSKFKKSSGDTTPCLMELGERLYDSCMQARYRWMFGLILQNADLNFRGKSGMTPLIGCLKAEENVYEAHCMALLLIERGADVDISDTADVSPLEYGLTNRRTDVIEKLVSLTRNIDAKNRAFLKVCEALLMRPDSIRYRKILSFFLKHIDELNVNIQNAYKATPLWMCAGVKWNYLPHESDYSDLLASDDIDEGDDTFEDWVSLEDLNPVEILIDAGADINQHPTLEDSVLIHVLKARNEVNINNID